VVLQVAYASLTGEGHRHALVPDRQEEGFYLAMHYIAGAAWVLGVADEAMATMRELVQRALRQRDADAGGMQATQLPSRRPQQIDQRSCGRECVPRSACHGSHA
jgi:hypothetical protein